MSNVALTPKPGAVALQGSQTSPAKVWKGFVQGSLGAAVGASASHPLDLIKVRMQLHTDGSKLSVAQLGLQILRQEGAKGLFRGVDASAARQIVYSGTRFGVYDVLKGLVATDSQPLSLPQKVACAAASGAIGAFAGNPADLALVRMQADGKLPEAQRRGYRSIFDAIFKIAGSEGIVSMWKTGVLPNMNRAAIITVGHLAAYDQSKEFLQKNGASDSIQTHLTASFMAAFIASVISNPVDVTKTRLMTQQAGSSLYKGMSDCFAATVRSEGPLALYKGFGATFARQCPYVVVTWLTIEQLKKLMNNW